MKQYIRLIIVAAALSSYTMEVMAQPAFDFLKNSSRIEQNSAVFLLIGIENGRNFVRALNNRAQPVKITLYLGQLNDALTGLTATSEQSIHIGAFDKSSTIYLNAFAPDSSWITGWAVDSETNDQALGLVTRDAEPFYRRPPRYPEDCIKENTETERVIVEFTISMTGLTQDIRIKDVTHGCSALAAHNAVRNWVYSAKLVDGHAKSRPGVITMLTFVLED